MCTVNKCGCSGGSKSDSTGVLAVLAAFFTGLYWLMRNVIGPALVVVSVLAWRWFSGAPMTGRSKTGATFLHGAPPPTLPAPRFGMRLHWAYWPGYQRALVRCVLTALVIGGWLAPLLTAVIVTVALLTTVAAAVIVRRRAAASRGVIRVKAQVLTQEPRPIQAITATASTATPTWSSTTRRVVS